HHELHSFPTRRSSDLRASPFAAESIRPTVSNFRPVRAPCWSRILPRAHRTVVSPNLLYLPCLYLSYGNGFCSLTTYTTPGAVGKDRKSTRLNSSHSQI